MIKFVSDLRHIGIFFPGTPVSSTSITDSHDIAEILLKVALNTITPNPAYLKITYQSPNQQVQDSTLLFWIEETFFLSFQRNLFQLQIYNHYSTTVLVIYFFSCFFTSGPNPYALNCLN